MSSGLGSGTLSIIHRAQERMLPAQLFFWTHDYNPSIKAAVSLMGHGIGECRRPQLPLRDAELAALREALQPLTKRARQVA